MTVKFSNKYWATIKRIQRLPKFAEMLMSAVTKKDAVEFIETFNPKSFISSGQNSTSHSVASAGYHSSLITPVSMGLQTPTNTPCLLKCLMSFMVV